MWGNSPDQIVDVAGSTTTVNYSDVQGGWTGAGQYHGDFDPGFVRHPDPGPDATWNTDDDDYGDLRLTTSSSCIDAGDNAAALGIDTDLSGNPRFLDNPDTPDSGNGAPPVVDMGAYEFPPDCDESGVPDFEEIADGLLLDCNLDTVPDSCEMANCPAGRAACPNCNANGIPDECDIASLLSFDANDNGVPDECESCSANAVCDDGSACTFDQCAEVCFNTTAAYADLVGAGGTCGPDGTVNLFDIFAVLDGFVNSFTEGCELTNIDIAGSEGSCGSDGSIDLFDILAVLDGFQGMDACCSGTDAESDPDNATRGARLGAEPRADVILRQRDGRGFTRSDRSSWMPSSSRP